MRSPFACLRQRRPIDVKGNLDDLDRTVPVPKRLPGHVPRTDVVHHEAAAAPANSANQGIAEIALLGRRRRPLPPKLCGEIPQPLSVVKDELFDVFLLGQLSEQQMVQDRVVQNNDPRRSERRVVRRSVEGGYSRPDRRRRRSS